jgi:[glutamine synthetase] adenylyltransferase / [glutamine synthetase]-adenylyl-L-tyrosine phosphorylase
MTEPFPLLARLTSMAKPADPKRVERALADLKEAAKAPGAAALVALLADKRAKPLLTAVFGNSPYLTRLILRDPPMLAALAGTEPEAALEQLLARLSEPASNFEALMALLRRAKREAALLVALADLGGIWPVLSVTGALTRFADAAIGAAVRFLLAAERAAGRLLSAAPGSGFIVLGMGKYGAGELNYSSDVDLIVFFDKARFRVVAGQDAQMVAVRITQALVRALAEQTADGYVFRTDLRLRPDAGATQVALSTEAAEIYYESMGQNWERAAMIKARACAGDPEAGEAFLASLKPFLWRRHLDFAAIEDIHSIKRQIHLHKGHGKIAIAGHNIKLGRGGIREIEFFVQTQQLILGGREPRLRGRTTCGMLDELAALGLITKPASVQLKEAYLFLRMVEHRLQMVEDAQTHSLPAEPEALEHIALFCGFSGRGAFEAKLRAVLETVQRHYAALFENAPPLAEESGSLVFTGVDDDPETLETLSQMGFHRASDISATIRGWHHGRFRATRSPRARELLTKLVPLLLSALARTGDPDTAFFRFNHFLESLPAGVQFFSLLTANLPLLDVLAQTFGTAPRLAAYLAHHSALIDALLDADFAARLPDAAELARQLAAALADARDYQDRLDAMRRFAREQNFRVGFQILNGAAEPKRAGAAFADIAATVITGLMPHVAKALTERHGRLRKGSVAVIGMGKLGGREMSATSDLDLIFVYDAPEEAVSDGPKPLAASDYYARFAQRMVGALTVPTAEGKLYDVDMLLRPSGNAGPVATRLSAFAQYQQSEAWTWEHMALTRARPVAGEDALGRRVAEVVRQVLTRPRDPAKTARDVVEMRAKLSQAHPGLDPWALKYVRGGIVDLEFIAQYLELVHGAAAPGILSGNTRLALRRLGEAGCLSPAAAQTLERAAALVQSLHQILRVAVEGPFRPEDASPGLARLLCRVTEAPSLGALERALLDAERDVHALFGALVEQAV